MKPAGPPFETVVFDCDSTLVAIEGIDELARRRGIDIADDTRAAMEGRLPLEAVYRRRLERVRPSREDMDWLARRYVESLVPGAVETVLALAVLGKKVHIVSGGLEPAVRAVAERLGIDRSRVHAVAVRFGAGGEYAGYDTASPLARSGGKREVCAGIVASDGGPAALVGDGLTDVEAGEAGLFVVGFGGVVARPEVRRRADAWCPGPGLVPVLDHLLAPDERHAAGPPGGGA
ncbi:MAG: haloacid dehalogenase [Acidobacteria bacterium]|nr:MAG: haloacid dehalogenase [Acidobacteriota bacterium]